VDGIAVDPVGPGAVVAEGAGTVVDPMGVVELGPGAGPSDVASVFSPLSSPPHAEAAKNASKTAGIDTLVTFMIKDLVRSMPNPAPPINLEDLGGAFRTPLHRSFA
jgi:hypothetical protein